MNPIARITASLRPHSRIDIAAVFAAIRMTTTTSSEFGENMLLEIERCARAGIPALQILKMATRDAAEHLGADDLGMVAAGKLADLVLVDGDPIVNIADLRNVWREIRNGEVVT